MNDDKILLRALDLMQQGMEKINILLIDMQQQINKLNKRITYLETQRSE
jgi:hypothetical protein